tara:strand:- start:82 stop:741 length:660 start_codon:yes stop_codon:yes gene_type:complete
MMTLNFSNRILTSIILLLILYIGLLDKFFCLYMLIAISVFSFIEFKNLINRIFNKNKNKIYFFYAISFFYLIFFVFSSYELYVFSKKIFILIFVICIFSDTGGYVVGKLIGGKKLTKISPKKTISGSIGSFIFSLSPIIIFSLIFEIKYQFEDLKLGIVISLFFSLICQLGDLIISYFKRQAKVKDTGSLLPGHGGLLDRIDGMIFVLPSAYLLGKFLF